MRYPTLVLKYIYLFIVLTSDCTAHETLETLRSKYTINQDVLTTATGEKYFRYPYESDIHFELYYYMKDPRAADTVYKAYKKHILPIVIKLSEEGSSNGAKEAFTKALIQVCLLFGNPAHSPEDAFFLALNKEDVNNRWKDFHAEIKEFIKEANTPLYVLKSKKKSDIFTIVIITTSVSGGNNAVSDAMMAFFEKHKNIRSIVIDIEDIATEVDPLMIATNTCTYDKIYSSIFQVSNQISVLSDRKKLNREVQQFIPNTLLANVKHKIANINPDLIITTRAYTCEDIAYASLGIPFRMFHADFELCPSSCSYYSCVSPDSIRFWIPNCCPSIFKPMFDYYKKSELYDEKDDETTLFTKLSSIVNMPKDDFQAQFEVLGYPCSYFYKIDDKDQLVDLRNKWNINQKDIPVFIVMGKHSTASIQEIYNELSGANSNLPFKFIFICGKNSELKMQLEKKVCSSSVDTQNRFLILGLLSPSEMNEIMNLSAMGVSKAGGATVMEALELEKHLLLMHSHPWEKVNAAYLMQMGLATQYDEKVPLINQIEQCVNKAQTRKASCSHLVNWKENLTLYIDLVLYEKLGNLVAESALKSLIIR